MKKYLISLLLFLAFSSYISAKNDLEAVSMISYEQRWLDDEGTLALKNNTKENIHNISFIIKYQDINGKDLDYKEFLYDITIAPGMTKKLNIPAYESNRNYHYYKTKDESGHPSFKIEYQLTGYNTSKSSNNTFYGQNKNHYSYDTEDNTSTSETVQITIAIIICLCIIGLYLGIYVLVAVMAHKRKRNVIAWLILSFFITPLLIVIILYCIGEERKEN